MKRTNLLIGPALCGLACVGVNSMLAQSGGTVDSVSLHEVDEPIEDNSFLVEEAYNQEPGVVQHISTATFFPRPQREFLYAFTQEWPLGSRSHQLSVTVPFGFLDASGPGDIFLNYRFQLFSKDEWAAFAPRISLIIPTGRVDKGLGDGVTGVQVNLPLSKRVSQQFVVHVNLGGTLLPNVEGGTSPEFVTKTITSFNVGGSIIFLPTHSINLICEVVTNVIGTLDGTAEVEHITETIVNPGVRFAIDVGDVQIVPGLAFPLSFADVVERAGIFLYLSFEHPFSFGIQ